MQQRLESLARPRHCIFRGESILLGPRRFDSQVRFFDLQLRQLLPDPPLRHVRVLHRVAQRGGCIDGCEDFAARRLDVALEPLDVALNIRILGLFGSQGAGGLLPSGGRIRRGLAPRLELQPCRLASRLERLDLRFDVERCGRELFDLMTVEGDLLLQAAVLELAGVRRFPRGSCRRVRGRQLEPQPLERRLQLGERDSRRRLSDPSVGKTGTRRLDRFAEQPIAPRELDFLPAAQLLPKASVTARLCRLPLQRPTLFLHLVHDVVDAREILLRCFELELRGATTALVLRDARGFFDELTAIGRAGAQNLADLSLLDDGVGLHAESGIHQEVLDVPQPAGRAVDQVFALTGAVQAAHQLDVADDQRNVILDGERPCRSSASSATPVSTAGPRRAIGCGRCRFPKAPRAATPDRRSRTSAAAVGFRASLPPKITSSMRSPRRLFALCSPRTHVKASTTLLLPQPLGPTMAVTPLSNVSSDRSGKLLKPAISRRFSRMTGTSRSGASPRTLTPSLAGTPCPAPMARVTPNRIEKSRSPAQADTVHPEAAGSASNDCLFWNRR